MQREEEVVRDGDDGSAEGGAGGGELPVTEKSRETGEKKVEKPLPSRKQSYDAEMAKESAMIQTVKVQKEEEDKLVFLNAETRKKENCEFGVRKKLSAANFVGGEACSEA